MTLTPEEFVRAWQSSGSLAEVLRETGLRTQTACARASRYRKKGIALKRFVSRTPTRPPLNVAALNQIAKDALRNGQGPTPT